MIRLDLAASVATVCIANPAKLNAMSRSMWRELRLVFEAIQQNRTLRCVHIYGAQGNFCSGGDISEYASFRFAEDSLKAFHEGDVWGGLAAMLACDVPIVAQIDGNCIGAGLEIASCCDLRIAAQSARFGAPIAKLGFPMAPREAALVVEAVGELTAREMLLTASVLAAPEMKLRGFLNAVTSDADLATATQKQLERVVTLAPAAARLNKQSLRSVKKSIDQSIRAQQDIDLIANAYQYANSAEHREGVTAFGEKRQPQF